MAAISWDFRLVVGIVGLLGLAGPARADKHAVRLDATADVWVSDVAAESGYSMGRTTRLKLKSMQEMALLDFDWSKLGRWTIVSAELFVRSDPASVRAAQQRLGLGPVFPLRLIGVSTVSAAWSEGAGARIGPDPTGEGATFHSRGGKRDWAWPGSRLCDVIFGNGQSLYRRAELEQVGQGGWWKVRVDAALIESLRSGGGFGICLTDDSTGPGGQAANNLVFSREQADSGPYLLVTVGDADKRSDGPLTVNAASVPAGSDTPAGQVTLFVADPPEAVGYRVKADGRPLAPWQIERSARRTGATGGSPPVVSEGPASSGPAGRADVLTISDLPPGRQVELEVAPICLATDHAPTRLTARTSPRPPAAPALPAARFDPVPAGGDEKGTVVVLPELVKVDPFGKVLEPAGAGSKAPWGAAIDLPAARGEIVACQLLIDASNAAPGPITVEASDFAGPAGRIPAARHVRLFRVWYVKAGGSWQPELAVPLAGPLAVPDPRNAIPGQTHQLVWLDVAVPPNAAAGRYDAKVTVTAGRLKREATVRLKVFTATIPPEVHFSPELNMYGPPGAPPNASYYDAHRLAHYHRAAINVVPYHQGRRGDERYRPRLAGSGGLTRVADWAEFDRNHGPLLDGSAFNDNPRGPVPVAAFYLPLYEYWPAPFLENYAYDKPPTDTTISLHHLSAGPIEQAVSREFRQAFRNVAADFRDHVRARGWSRTVFQFYLNNKYSKAGTMFWNLDEPACRQDFHALRFFGRLFAEGLSAGQAAPPGEVASTRPDEPKLWYRIDVSRPQWQFDDLDGLVHVMYVGRDAFNMPRTVRRVAERAGAKVFVYGACNPPDRSNFESVAWCYKSFLIGGEGVLPWQSLDRAGKSFTSADPNGLIVWGGPAGHEGWVASLRVFALRRGAQDVELLRLLAARGGYGRDVLAELVGRYVPLGTQLGPGSVDEAAAVRFESPSSGALLELKAGLLAALEQPVP